MVAPQARSPQPRLLQRYFIVITIFFLVHKTNGLCISCLLLRNMSPQTLVKLHVLSHVISWVGNSGVAWLVVRAQHLSHAVLRSQPGLHYLAAWLGREGPFQGGLCVSPPSVPPTWASTGCLSVLTTWQLLPQSKRPTRARWERHVPVAEPWKLHSAFSTIPHCRTGAPWPRGTRLHRGYTLGLGRGSPEALLEAGCTLSEMLSRFQRIWSF